MQNQPPQSLPYALPGYFHDRDVNHLNLLALFHYIMGGLIILFSSIFIIYIVLGGMMAGGALPGNGPNPGPPPAVGWLMVGFGTLAVAIGWTCGILTIYSGRCPKARRRWTFSFVIACILCFSVPIGTVLGVFTIVILLRDSAKSLYGIIRA